MGLGSDGLGLELRPAGDDVPRSALGVLERPPDVLADDAEPKAVQSAEERDQQDGRSIARHGDVAQELRCQDQECEGGADQEPCDADSQKDRSE